MACEFILDKEGNCWNLTLKHRETTIYSSFIFEFASEVLSLQKIMNNGDRQILVCTLYLTLTYVNIIPPSLTGLIVSRDLFLVYAGNYLFKIKNLSLYFKNFHSLPFSSLKIIAILKIFCALQHFNLFDFCIDKSAKIYFLSCFLFLFCFYLFNILHQLQIIRRTWTFMMHYILI